jgi:hypothetical protein
MIATIRISAFFGLAVDCPDAATCGHGTQVIVGFKRA